MKFQSLTDPGGISSPGTATAWQVNVRVRHELWQLRLAGRANLHFTSEHMSGWGLYPLGCTGVFRFPWTDPPACLSHLALFLNLWFVCSSICLSTPISLFWLGFTQNQPWAFRYLVFNLDYYAYLSIHPARGLVPGMHPKLHHPQCFPCKMTSDRRVKKKKKLLKRPHPCCSPQPLPHPETLSLSPTLLPSAHWSRFFPFTLMSLCSTVFPQHCGFSSHFKPPSLINAFQLSVNFTGSQNGINILVMRKYTNMRINKHYNYAVYWSTYLMYILPWIYVLCVQRHGIKTWLTLSPKLYESFQRSNSANILLLFFI